MRLVSRSICYEYTGWKSLQKPCALMEDLYLPAAGARCQLMLISFTCPSVMKMVRLYLMIYIYIYLHVIYVICVFDMVIFLYNFVNVFIVVV